MSFPSWPYRISRRGSQASCHRPLLLRAAPLHPSPCARRPGSQRPPRARRLWIELVYERRRNPLDYLDLLGGQVFPPAARLGLASFLALALLLPWYVLPGVLLNRARKPGLLHGDLQGRVDVPHRAQCIGPQVLVANHYLAAPVRLVGLPGLLYLLHVGVRAHPRVGVGVSVQLRPTSLVFPSPREPASLAAGVHTRGDDVSRVPDQEDHTALWQGLHEQRRTYGAVRLLYDEVSAPCNLGEPGGRPAEDQVPHWPEPGLLVGFSEDGVPAQLTVPHPEVIEVAEEISYQRLVPHGVSVEALHHGAKPRAATTARAEDPDDVLRPYAVLLAGTRRPRGSRAHGPAPSHGAPPDLLEPRRQCCSSHVLRRTCRPRGDCNDLLP